jgi:hypothetical protein
VYGQVEIPVALTTCASGFSNNYDKVVLIKGIRSVLSILHEHTNYNYQLDIMNTVIKPISLFLNDIEERHYLHSLTLLMLSTLVIMTSLIKATCLLLHIIEGGTYKFIMTCVTFLIRVPFKDSFQVENSKVIRS